MGEVIVRRADESDWQLVRRVRLAALADSPTAFASTLAREQGFDAEEWKRRVAPRNWALALVDGEPVGCAAGIVEAGRPDDERHLVAMWVSPDWRSRDVAARLVDEVQRWAEEQGATVLSLWLADGNDRGRRFYERIGFTSTGERQTLPSHPSLGEERYIRR